MKANLYRIVGAGSIVLAMPIVTAVAAHAATLGRFGRY
jgi:hypothetical protein